MIVKNGRLRQGTEKGSASETGKMTHFSDARGESLTERVKLEFYCQILKNDISASQGNSAWALPCQESSACARAVRQGWWPSQQDGEESSTIHVLEDLDIPSQVGMSQEVVWKHREGLLCLPARSQCHV